MLPFKNIPPAEKILLLLMAFLLIQFFVVLTGPEAQDTESIDVVQRSVAAMVFGYFIGGSFGEKQNKTENTDAVSKIQLKGEATGGASMKKIGFVSQMPEQERTAGSENRPPEERYVSVNGGALQIWIAGGIGFAALALMFMVRNMESLHEILQSQSGVATLSQLRDFAAGSVGFLISTSRNR